MPKLTKRAVDALPIEAKDYLFHGNDPFMPPPNPDELSCIGDINTGMAYIKTYEAMITNPKRQILLPIIFYIDGAATGQFANLPVTPLKFTLGIFNRKARMKPHFWRTLGYVPVIHADRSRGMRQVVESRHVEAINVLQTEQD